MSEQGQAVAPQSNANEAPTQNETVKAEPTQAKANETKETTTKQEAKAPQAQAEKYEIKVNGKVKQVTKDELIRLAQLSEAATDKFETAAQKEKRIQSILSKAKTNPMEALMDPDLGLTKEQIRGFVEDWYNREFIEPDTLTPEQKRLKELERENAQFKKIQQEAEEKAKQEAEAKAEAEYTQVFQQEIIDAIEANKLPKTKSTVKKIAFYKRQALLNGWEAPMELICEKVRSDIKSEDSEVESYTYDDFVNRFGEKLIKKLISEDLKRIREKREGASKSFSNDELKPSSKKSDKVSMRDAAKKLKEMAFGG